MQAAGGEAYEGPAAARNEGRDEDQRRSSDRSRGCGREREREREREKEERHGQVRRTTGGNGAESRL